MRTNRFWRAAAVGTVGIAIAVHLTACTTGGGATGRALEVFRATAAESPDTHVYATEVAARAAAPELGAYLLEAAADPAYDVAAAALHGLEDRDVDGGADALRPVFEEKRGALKVAAALALARQADDGAAVEWLESTLSDDRYRPGANVTTLLVEKGRGDPVRAYLQAEVDSDDPRRRDEACLALGRIANDWAKTMLVEGLDRERGERRERAIVAIGMTGDPALERKIIRFRNTQGLVLSTLDALGRLGGPDSVAALREALTAEESIVRLYAAVGLVRAGYGDETVTLLTTIAAEGDAADRGMLAARLGDVDRPEARAILATLARDADPAVRLEAVRGLVRIGSSAEVPAFLDLAADPDYRIQAVAIEGLGRFGDAAIVDTTLAPLLETDNPYVRINAAAAAVEIGARGAAG